MEPKEIIRIGLENSQRVVKRTLDGLTSEELQWQPRPDANSIGLILLHMLRVEDSSTHVILQHKPQIWETGKWYEKMHKDIKDGGAHYSAEQVASFVVPPVADLTAYSEAVRSATLEYLQKQTPDDFSKNVTIPPPPGPPRPSPFGPNPTAGFMWQMLVTHLAQHAGEISYIRGLKRGLDK